MSAKQVIGVVVFGLLTGVSEPPLLIKMGT